MSAENICHGVRTYVCVCMFMYPSAFAYVCTFVRVCVSFHALLHACVHVCMYVCIRVRVFVCMYVSMHVCTCVRVFTFSTCCPFNLLSSKRR